VELHGERSKAVLLDTLPAPALPLLRPGEQQEAVVSHDIRELGPHTLSCAAAWAGADGERAYDSQAFRFTVANPVVVRTKVGAGAAAARPLCGTCLCVLARRTHVFCRRAVLTPRRAAPRCRFVPLQHRLVAQDVLLEATLENRTKAPMLLDAVRLVPAPPYTAQTLDPPAPAAAAAAPGAGPLVAYADAVPLLPPEGGAKSFVFRLRRGEGQGEGAGESAAGGGAVADPGGGAALGRVEIRWRGPMGDPARLQTQLISMPPSPARDLRLSLGPLPPRVHVEQPFTAHVLIANASDRRLGPLKLSFTAAGSAGAPSVVMEGAQSVVVDEVAPRGTASVGLRLLPLAPGTQLVQGLLLTDDRDGRVFDTLRPAEVFVHGPAAAAL
jgi:hypothetical protein